jgi:hypothetical protein
MEMHVYPAIENAENATQKHAVLIATSEAGTQRIEIQRYRAGFLA